MVLSNEEQEFIKRKHEATLKLRQEFLKQSSNPYRHATGEGGTVFDAGLARFQAMRVSNYEHFKPTGKSFRTGLFAVVLPIALYAWALKAERDGREEKYRTGQVAYKDRQFKFI
uniref:NADH dehydrogenase [ubiquinone] 1 beta subcomplex subunit 4 n=1 Tax=Drosophila melanogaster TaxID=7227 RepID=Q6IDF5_DROME|eukprot:NP_610985.1 NADH dehydrogenase (ubiquinone) B15 subunit [Drosophila melanogaster]